MDFIKSLFKKKKKFPPKDFSVFIDGPANKRPIVGDWVSITHLDPNFVSDGIEFFTNGTCSHVALYVGGGDRQIIEALSKGVVVSSLDKYFKDNLKITIRRIPNLSIVEAEQMKSRGYKIAEEDKGYDWGLFFSLMIVGIFRKLGWKEPEYFKNLLDSRDRWICSEVYDDCALKVKSARYPQGIRLCKNSGSGNTTPED